jgi:PAS domain S-box-containing protein
MPDNDSVLQAVVDSLPDVIFYKDLDGVYRAGNKAWGELVGQPVGELLGKTDFDLFPHDVAAGFREQDLEMLRGGQRRRNEESLEYPDGRRTLVDTLKAPVFDRDGAVIGLVGSCRDITGQADSASR